MTKSLTISWEWLRKRFQLWKRKRLTPVVLDFVIQKYSFYTPDSDDFCQYFRFSLAYNVRRFWQLGAKRFVSSTSFYSYRLEFPRRFLLNPDVSLRPANFDSLVDSWLSLSVWCLQAWRFLVATAVSLKPARLDFLIDSISSSLSVLGQQDWNLVDSWLSPLPVWGLQAWISWSIPCCPCWQFDAYTLATLLRSSAASDYWRSQ